VRYREKVNNRQQWTIVWRCIPGGP